MTSTIDKPSDFITNDLKKCKVAKGQIVLVECQRADARIWVGFPSNEKKIYNPSQGTIKGLGSYMRPIFISHTEKIKIDDFFWRENALHVCGVFTKYHPNDKKVIVTGDQFSDDDIKQIVENKFKYLVLVELMTVPLIGKYDDDGKTIYKEIVRLDKNKHAIFHDTYSPYSIVKKTYTFDQMLDAYKAGAKHMQTGEYNYFDDTSFQIWMHNKKLM